MTSATDANNARSFLGERWPLSRAVGLNPRPSRPRPLSRARGRRSQEQQRNKKQPRSRSSETTTVSPRHLPVAEERVPAREADVEAEALDDHALDFGVSTRADLVSPRNLRKRVRHARVLCLSRPRDKCLAGTFKPHRLRPAMPTSARPRTSTRTWIRATSRAPYAGGAARENSPTGNPHLGRVEAAGIEPASADAPERASTSLSCR